MYTAKEVLAAFNATINGSEEIYRTVAKSFGLSDCAFWILYCIRQSEEKSHPKRYLQFYIPAKADCPFRLEKDGEGWMD